MAYVGRGLTTGANYQKLDDIVVDDTTTFTMEVNDTAVTPAAEHVILGVNGVIQEPNVGFTVSGSTCTLASAIDNDGGTDTIWGVIAGNAAYVNNEFGSAVTHKNTVTVGEEDTGHDVKFFGATASAYMLWDESADDLILAGAGGLSVAGTSALAGVTVSGDIDMEDDKGIIFGSGDDWFFGAGAGEAYLGVFMGSSQGPTATGGEIKFLPYDSTGYDTKMFVVGAEGGEARLFLYSDQGDDTSDQWSFDAHPNDGDMFLNVGSNTADETFKWTSGGSGHADDVWEDNTWDYAELFEWKTHLASDAAVKDLYGMSVVLDGDKVRVAELGEEDKILGVVRPKGSTAAHGDGLKWQKKYIRNVWGEYEEEGYTMVSWQEFLPNGNVSYRHAYHKDEIPEYRLNDGIGRDKENYTKEENFSLDKDGEKIPVIVPSTEEEKTAANYIERTTHKTSGKTLTRRKYNDDYDPSIPYIGRAARLKEWVLIGLLGQVPVRTSAVIPDHWVKQKDLESGIDFYYIFNK